MAMNAVDIVAGVFSREQQARTALDALRSAGFAYDQIGVATQANQNVNLAEDFLDLGLSQDRANYYDQEYRKGRTVVSVRPDGRDQEALNILRSNGGYDYDQREGSGIANAVGATGMNTAQTMTNATTGAYDNNTLDTANGQDQFYQPRTLRLREEQLNVNKERVQAGEVRLRKDVVEEQQTINVPVTHEEVYIERRPVTDAAVDNTPIGTDEVISIPVTEEKVNVTKNTVVTGEVAIGKREVQQTQQVVDTVKREELHVERQGNALVDGADENLLQSSSARTDSSDLNA